MNRTVPYKELHYANSLVLSFCLKTIFFAVVCVELHIQLDVMDVAYGTTPYPLTDGLWSVM